ncbi:hypothetical protein HMPREF1092_00189 [Clostridium thermobutyricum]|uniref:Uncharacterized protein n=2 Tax=Clostridium thermobutyricum TaxID=29372 RepID=N9XTG3_9CLOT|nr:hypothetical protein HMPREF1092_00189 [Clostridium thermobutyricum]OPX47287.1 hypothetical protein CLTHE_18500 [Clostridium thermobutyricum DSM 4928]
MNNQWNQNIHTKEAESATSAEDSPGEYLGL